MRKENKNSEPLTTGQIADYCHVTYRAVLKWIAEGKLKAYRTPGKHSRVRPEDFLEFLNNYKMPVPKDLESVQPSRKRILIVDDDREMVNSMKRTLMLENLYEMASANDGFSAGRKFAEFLPDLIILDINMPNMNGYEVCEYIRNAPEHHHVRILVVSGVLGMDDGKRIRAAGADDCLSKPFDNNMLKSKINALLGLDANGR